MRMPTPAEILCPLISGRYDTDKISMEVVDAGPSTVSLEYIWSESCRRAGHASKALDALCDVADRLGFAIVLEVHWLAYETEGYAEDDEEGDRLDDLNDVKLDNLQLAQWYARRGFVETGRADYDNPIMRREPRRPEGGPTR